MQLFFVAASKILVLLDFWLAILFDTTKNKGSKVWLCQLKSGKIKIFLKLQENCINQNFFTEKTMDKFYKSDYSWYLVVLNKIVMPIKI